MVKTIMITLDVDIPETELGKAATVTIGTNSYTGVARIIIIHEVEAGPSTVTLEAQGLKVKTA